MGKRWPDPKIWIGCSSKRGFRIIEGEHNEWFELEQALIGLYEEHAIDPDEEPFKILIRGSKKAMKDLRISDMHLHIETFTEEYLDMIKERAGITD